jgi:DNA-directed RNA polymerase specialized sigma24 family protein
MPPRPREIFLLSRERCLSYAEIAVTLGISGITVE